MGRRSIRVGGGLLRNFGGLEKWQWWFAIRVRLGIGMCIDETAVWEEVRIMGFLGTMIL